MKITTKVIGLLAVFAVYRVDAAAPLGALKDCLHEMDKSLYTNTIVEAAKEDNPGDKVLAKIKTQCGKLDPKIELGSEDEAKIKELVSVGVQDHQDIITPTALTGDVEYKFTYIDGANKEEVKIKRKEITDLLGKMAKLRMTQNDLTGMLTVKDDGTNSVANYAKELEKKNNDLIKSNSDLLARIVKLIKCLATENKPGTMYESLITQMVKDKADSTDCLQAAHAILLASSGSGVVAGGSALESLEQAVKNSDLSDARAFLTAPVLQAFTTLLFLQRTDAAKKGEVRNLNQYLITRGNAKKVMKDTGGKLLLCDDISLEKSGLLALGLTNAGVSAVIGTGADKVNIGTDAYVLPAAVLLDDEGKPVVGTPVIPAPYLEYAINHNELLPANNIIVDGTAGIDSVLTTYGTSLSLKDVATINASQVSDVLGDNDATGLSGVAGKVVPSGLIKDAEKMILAAGTDASGKNTSAESDTISLDKYGAQEPLGTKTFKFSLKAATAIMNSLLANTVVVKSSTDNDSTNNINEGPFYAGRIAAASCPAKSSKFTGDMLNSTAAIMLMSGKDGLRAKQAADEIVEVSADVENTNVAKRIKAVSEYVIPGFDLDSNGDYVVTGLDATKIDKLDGKTAGTTSEVLKGKGRELLSAISRISKSSK